MGTTWRVRMYQPPALDDAEVRQLIEAESALVVRQMSHWEADSDLSRFNQAAGATWHALPEELFEVLEFAFQVAQDTGGAFDPTIGHLVEEWGFGPQRKGPRVPSADLLVALRERYGWMRVELDRERRRARQTGGVSLDLSGVAKGYAVDRVAQVLDRTGVHSYLIEIGGELRAQGLKPHGEPWWVALESPGAELTRHLPEIRIALSGWSVATSGDYRRFVEIDGRRWAHTIDPRTGQPVSHALASVSVIHRDCMAADAYATALTVLGAEEGLAYANHLGLAAVFLVRSASGAEVRWTNHFQSMTE